MSDIKIHRDHSLGLPKARKIALKWAEDVEKDFGMECTITEGEFSPFQCDLARLGQAE